MGEIREVKVSDLLFWLENFRFGEAKSQEEAFANLCATNRFKHLVDSIKKYKFQASELLTVSPDNENPGKYVVYDGNRRLAALKQFPEIKKIPVNVEEDPDALEAILSRAHNGSDPAGHLRWTAVQKARRDKLLYDKEGGDNLSKRAIALNIIESATGKEWEGDFPISTFVRLFDYPDFFDKFGIEKDGTKVKKTNEIKMIIKDINDDTVNSRILNEKEDRIKYINSLFDEKSKAKWQDLLNDIKPKKKDKKKEGKNRKGLLKEQQLDELKALIKNPSFINELERASTNRYPHLLFFALRAILDTLENIKNGQESQSPDTLSANNAMGYIDEHEKKYRSKVKALIERLATHAHDVRNKSSENDLDNSRILFEKLIKNMIKEIKNNA